MTPLISVLVPVYNAEPFLPECLDGILKQTYSNLEIICCDDASQDGSLSVLRKYEAAEPRITVFAHERNQGVVTTRNDLLLKAHGDYIAWVDGDDYIAPDKLERQLAFLQTHPECGAVGTGINVVTAEREPMRCETYPDDPDRQRVDPCLCCATVLVTREAAVSAGPFRDMFKVGGEDGDWLLRIADYWTIRNLPAALYSYRQRPRSISKTNVAKIRRLGVVARAAARERRKHGNCPIDSGLFRDLSADEILSSALLTPHEKVLALSLPDMEAPPLVTVAIPFYNAHDYLGECLESLGRQSFQNFEVIIYDDGSTPPLDLSRLGERAAIPARLRVLRGEENHGPAFARNSILAAAEGRHVAFQDADDLSENERLWLQLEELFADPSVIAIGSGVRFIDETGRLLRSEVFPRDAVTRGGFNGCCGAFLYDRSRAREIRFDEEMRTASEDIHFLLQLETFGKIRNLRAVLYRYRVHSNSLTARSNWLEDHCNYMWQMFARRMGVITGPQGISSQRLIDLILAADGTQTAELLLTDVYRQWVRREIPVRRFIAISRLFPRSAFHILAQHFRLAVESTSKKILALAAAPVSRSARHRLQQSLPPRLGAQLAHAATAVARKPYRGLNLLRRDSAPTERPLEVRILGNWGDEEEALRMLLPGRRGRWDRVHFSTRGRLFRKPDYVLVLNQPNKPVRLRMSPNRVWFAIGEPPTKSHEPLHLAQGEGTVVFTPARYPTMDHAARIYQASHTMTRTWWVKRTFEELNRCETVSKQRMLSWVTSNISLLPGHRERLQFVERTRAAVEIDLFGRGFRAIADKWSALAPYYYSVAYENTRAPGYFTEKLMDCFACLTAPFYVGAPDIFNYFPSEAIITIDPEDPDVFDKIKAEMTMQNYARRLPALREAKHLVLTKYNMFIHLADAIMNDRRPLEKRRRIDLKPVSLDWSLGQ